MIYHYVKMCCFSSAAKYSSHAVDCLASFAGVRKQTTEYGSVASKNSHLAGSSHVAGSQVVQEFCIKKAGSDDESDDESDEDVQEKEIRFMEGKTCSFLCVESL